MKKNYNVISNDDEDDIYKYNEGIRYREYKKTIRNIQINFEQILSDCKDNFNYNENDLYKKKENELSEIISDKKKKVEQLENLHKEGIQNLQIMQNYFSHNKTYALEISRYLSIFDKFKIQLQSARATLDKICTYNNILYKKKRNSLTPHFNKENGNNISNHINNVNHVFKERSALDYSLSELDNILFIGNQTNIKLKLQNSYIVNQIKNINIINTHIPQIKKILKKIKHYNLKKTIILAIVIALCIFVFFMFR
ncbi:conserved Plasmodium protein, unknown function [Plasmodium berghei]|uniref:SNARE protein n=2 Tax=Plasmodium berghei TaxID=5821 RepID=A0A509AQ45_PLABA|nr:conserved Plasmodium protein, unknown function [Plasmodium berghei ANKA]CXI96549.1 conserved Plasmodium protein, unknown function [Plasmodium berghei]SCL97344.1 conserved Plasmodium protein, unknown function [Plasmodium berghei]SCM16598.1 conserved Plasmodium protein, unknown function [Plasmodium berghei]SCM18395.1 conserved Plasmodium protein, unknown function [Plasmodium berghei]SCN27825.1 conserved Plasmodium protein, unknown function [Plasmodium berghei]|eukprot:XP_034423479.1 conserved Plasmodium protein, unknown function [Plasmodium berghei ANKA]